MLPKLNRLTQEKDVKRVMTKGRAFFVKEFGIKSIRKQSNLLSKVGIIVPKKIAGTAVLRNRIKRQVRHIFLKRIDQIQPGYDIVFMARPDFLKLKFDEMEEKIISVLKRVKLLS